MQRAVWWGLVVVAVSACKQQQPGENVAQAAHRAPVEEVSLLDELRASVAVADTARDASPCILISEATWQSMAADIVASAPPKTRDGAAHAAAAAANGVTLGVYAEQAEGSFEAEWFIVARDLHVGLHGHLETRDFYLVTAHAVGSGLHGVVPQFALAETGFRATSCLSPARGCRPVVSSGQGHMWATWEENALGLGTTVVQNLESADGVGGTNASGFVPQLLITRPEAGAPLVNRFECRGDVSAEACSGAELPEWSSSLEAAAVAVVQVESAMGDAVLLREPDFLRLVSEGAVGTGSKETQFEAVRYATLGNVATTLGVAADQATAVSFSAQLAIVARDVGRNAQGNLEAREWYVVPAPISGFAEVVGFAPRTLMSDTFERLDSLIGPCGAVLIPRDAPECDWGPCMPGAVAEYEDARFGFERWQAGKPRASLRLPTFNIPFTPMASYACSEFQPPPSTTPPGGSCQPTTEACNGVDDDCNGLVDESSCAVVGCAP